MRSNADGISIHKPLYIVACGLLPENVNSPMSGLPHMETSVLPQLMKTSKEVLAIERWTACIATAMGSICDRMVESAP